MSIFSKIFGSREKIAAHMAGDVPDIAFVDYEEQRDIAHSGAVEQRLSLAANTKTNQEILYYLAENDPEVEVRKAVAQNKSTPVHAAPILSEDSSQDVRFALAARLVELLPDVSHDTTSRLYAYVVQALGNLALDEVLKIRVALSSTLKDHAYTPHKIAVQLARDVERQVSEPILRFCVALSDEDLIDILKGHSESWRVVAIAQRDTVSEAVAEAVIDADDIAGGRALLGNAGAQVGESLLNYIVEKARSLPEWQEPVVARVNLPPVMARRLAEFVEGSVRDLLLAREDFDAEITAEIAEVFRRRMEFASENGAQTASVQERLVRVVDEAGEVDEVVIADALAMRDYDFVNAALALRARVDVVEVERVLNLHAARPVIALCWKAGLSMRFALQVQKEIVKLQPKQLIYPKDGTEYPLSEEELIWQLEFLGLDKS